MSSAPSPAQIAADPSWLAQAMDPGSGNVRMVRMSAAGYRSESFLDDRIFQSPREHQIVPWSAIETALHDGTRQDARWIFHIGHVGSTLLSRLIGELDRVLSVREPRILRDLATAQSSIDNYLPGIRRLLSRTFAPEDVAVVKATSFASELAARLLPAGGRAIFVYATPQAYLGSCLAGDNTVKEVAVLAPSRAERMKDRVLLKGSIERPAYQVAAAWACEMTSLEQAATRLPPEAVHWIDFDRLLSAVPDLLADAARFLGIAAPPDRVAAVAAGPLMHRYSKALEYEYSPQLRRDLIAEASAEHATDIKGAIAMLEQAALDSPLLASALERSAVER